MRSGGGSHRLAEVGSALGLSFCAGAIIVTGWDLVPLAARLGDENFSSAIIFDYLPLLLIALPASLGFLAYLLARLRPGEGDGGGLRKRLPLIYDLIPSIPFVILIPGLFSGASIAASPWRFPIMGGAILLVASAVLGFRILVSWLGTAAIRRPLLGPLGFALSMGLVFSLRVVSTEVLPGLYHRFHQGCSLAAVAVASAGVYLLVVASRRPLPSGRAFAVLGFVAMAALPVGSWLSHGSPLARQVLIERAPFVGPFVGPAFTVHSELAGLFHDFEEPGGETESGSPFPRIGFEGEHRRSVVLVSVDALRGDVLADAGRFAGGVRELRRVSGDALRFDRAYSPGNYTPVSIPAMVLGYFPGPGHDPDGGEVIAAPFNRAGYSTEFHFTAHEYASLERTDLAPLASRGFFFTKYLPYYEPASVVLGKVSTTIERAAGPVFVWAHLSDVHSPFLLHGDPRGAGGRFERTYAGQLEYLDSVVGPFLHELTDRHPDMVWALTSDHGEALGEHGSVFHGSTLYDEQVRVPLLLSGPGVTPGVIEDSVSVRDLGVTLLALAGADTGSAPLLPTDPSVTSESRPVLLVGKTSCGIVRDRLKLIADPSSGLIALFDLDRDPLEKRNLIVDDRATAVELLGELKAMGCPHSLAGLSL